MSNETNYSLIDLGDLAKPADTLVKKIASATGILWEPIQIKRVAKAEAEASIIRAEAETKISDIKRRAIDRIIEEEAIKQKNIEEITAQALPHLTANANAEKMDNDWVMNFFDKSRAVSDKDMQVLWSKVLAGEANTPGTYSKRTVNLLDDLDKEDAELFTQLCCFAIDAGTLRPLVFDCRDDIYKGRKINFSSLIHLQSIGLIRFDNIAGFRQLKLPKRVTFSYYGEQINLEMNRDSDNELDIGQVLLTSVGEELAPICGSHSIPGFLDYVKVKWRGQMAASGDTGLS